jgi:hypothetical protein
VEVNKIKSLAKKMAENAKDGSLKIKGVTYKLKFHPTEWNYYVFDEQGELLHKFNTKLLKQAKQWLKEWYEN